MRGRLPRGVGVERSADLRVGEEPAACLVGLGDRGRSLEPPLDPFGDPRPDGTQLRERSPGTDERARLLRPEPRRPRCSRQRPAAVVGLLASCDREQLAEIAVGQRCGRCVLRRSVPTPTKAAPAAASEAGTVEDATGAAAGTVECGRSRGRDRHDIRPRRRCGGWLEHRLVPDGCDLPVDPRDQAIRAQREEPVHEHGEQHGHVEDRALFALDGREDPAERLHDPPGRAVDPVDERGRRVRVEELEEERGREDDDARDREAVDEQGERAADPVDRTHPAGSGLMGHAGLLLVDVPQASLAASLAFAAASFAASLVVAAASFAAFAGRRGGVLRSLAGCRGGVLRSLAGCRGGVLRTPCRLSVGGVLRSLAGCRGGVLRGVGGCREGLRRLRVHVIGGERVPFVDARARAPPDDGDGGDHATQDQQSDQEFPHRHLPALRPRQPIVIGSPEATRPLPASYGRPEVTRSCQPRLRTRVRRI